MGVLATATIDTSVLEQAIPMVTSLTMRSLEQQCVTSLGIIFINTQKAVPAASIPRIDANLERTATPKKGKNRQNLTVGELRVISRTHKNSAWNRATGNRWQLTMPKFNRAKFERAYGDPGASRLAFMGWLEAKAASQKAAIHSSTHYLKSGFVAAIRLALSSRLFVAWRSNYSKSDALAANNPLNRQDKMRLGGLTIDLGADSVTVTGENNVGEGGPADVLNEKHRAALLRYAVPAGQTAVNNESLACLAEYDRRWSEGVRPIQKMLG